ncbi:pirin family protein [Paenibacillus thiaminolyticus]|uniref:Pirin n=1 Tax=Paenibacillus thiaminolyticus TaxID=49283 RepID=A0AAP9DXC5_PANTH|nr:pirin family protein [Paenibacillus thiaminolyticus]MCY9535062.1 pirin family protein [Paenibacillus thiaminolyticus]MCY9605193.1 pirin family protein [Paenibacillus thiaminolyticus]MCY9606044.1 pirin family protein [Paenibacillus thiaminolyticus]MCY9615650.1 pirin family protein [Paenibacillus thiaminolyticus]MCY9620447.1 pirin family protein [Paenibacillus thiaminolyticus]
MKIQRYTASQMGTGAFDGGRITEIKPIGFPHEGGAVTRVSTLFYWAWAKAKEEGYIPPHPHQAFEILSYVIQGKTHHGDSLGTDSVVGAGGAQLIQAGSGVEHSERIVGPDADMLQIWFEPNLLEARKRPPHYAQFEHEAFPVHESGGATVKTVLGDGAPFRLVADARMWDITVQAGYSYEAVLPPGRTWTGLIIGGKGSIGSVEAGEELVQYAGEQFIISTGKEDDNEILRIQAEEATRLIAIEVPTNVDYPLYRK